MTLEEATIHAREKAKELRDDYDYYYDHWNDDEKAIAEGCIECAKEHEQLAEWLEELAKRREADRWISVSERLPENDDYVLAYDNSDMFVAWFSGKTGWHSSDNRFDKYIPIIAWKPLPEPYESEDRK